MFVLVDVQHLSASASQSGSKYGFGQPRANYHGVEYLPEDPIVRHFTALYRIAYSAVRY